MGSRQSDLGRDITRVVDDARQALTDAGATVVDVQLDDTAMGSAMQQSNVALTFEFKHDLNTYLAGRGGTHPRDLAELIQFNKDNSTTELVMAEGNQAAFEAAEQTSTITDPGYIGARQTATSQSRAVIDTAMDTNKLDAIIAPTNGPAWVTNIEEGDDMSDYVSSAAAAIAGYPNITVPAGFGCDDELPIGMSFFGRQWTEPTLLAIAYAFEQTTHAYRLPDLTPSVDC